MLHTFTFSLSGTHVLHAFIEPASPFLSISWNPLLADNLELMFLAGGHLFLRNPQLPCRVDLPVGLIQWRLNER